MEPATTASRSILETRAAALARPLVQEQEADTVSLVTFLVGERSYGVASDHVQCILGQAAVSRVPWAPPSAVGVTNVHGDIVPVADVGRLLGAGPCRPGGPIVVIGHDDARLALLAEAISDLVVVPGHALVAPDRDVTATTGLVVGFTEATLVLDAGALLTVPWLTGDTRRTDDHSAG